MTPNQVAIRFFSQVEVANGLKGSIRTDNIKAGKSIIYRYETYPESKHGMQSWINFKVNQAHLTSVKKGMPGILRMGQSHSRTLTIIGRR